MEVENKKTKSDLIPDYGIDDEKTFTELCEENDFIGLLSHGVTMYHKKSKSRRFIESIIIRFKDADDKIETIKIIAKHYLGFTLWIFKDNIKKGIDYTMVMCRLFHIEKKWIK